MYYCTISRAYDDLVTLWGVGNADIDCVTDQHVEAFS